MAAARIESELSGGPNIWQESMQASSTVSLKDALQQAKETAQRLDRDIFESQKHRATYMPETTDKKPRGGEIVNL